MAQAIYSRASAAWSRKGREAGSVWLWLANRLVFPQIRKKLVGENIKALICGSAPLTPGTQSYFAMLGIPVLQVYGLTETTGICTMGDPRDPVPGRVGPAIPGIEMKLSDNDEIVVRGLNVFPGYWNRPEQTAEVLRDGWFHTGDQGELDHGTWRIVGRLKNLIVLGSGHKLAPESMEDEIQRLLPNAQQVVIIGNGRGYLSAIITGDSGRDQVQAVLDRVNAQHPHYKQIRAFCVRKEPFSIENGMLTANGKLKRDLISKRMSSEIEDMYQAVKTA
jgi:long-chain acyl-CoA synthetase